MRWNKTTAFLYVGNVIEKMDFIVYTIFMTEFKSFYKTVGGGEGDKCSYPTRLDTYGCGCSHDCDYCYAKSLLDFRGLWHPDNPSVVNIKEVEKVVRKIPNGTIVRLGGMTDCFQPVERIYKATYNTSIQKAVVEFLLVNGWIKKWLKGVDWRKYVLKEGGYRFLRLNDKKAIIRKITIPEITVCEDYSPHFKYWNVNVNPNRDDCCNLRKG